MKIKYFILLVTLVLVSTNIHSQPVNTYGQLQVKGSQLSDANGNPVVLRGVSFGWHNFWPRFYNEEAVSWLASDWQVSVVRAAMGVEPKAGYKLDSTGSVEKVKAVIDGAIKAGVYVIIDWHSHNINLEEAKTFFSQMAGEYGSYPNVIYEIFNEPDYESWDSVKIYSEEVINVIRKYDPDNVILVGSPHWDQDIHIVADSPLLLYNNIMYTVHYYAATHKQGLRDRCNYAISKGIPIFISESAGMEATGDGPLNDSEWIKWIEWSEQNKISWVTWSVSDKNETCSMLLPSADSKGNWTEKDLKESGIKTRALIKKYNKDIVQ